MRMTDDSQCKFVPIDIDRQILEISIFPACGHLNAWVRNDGLEVMVRREVVNAAFCGEGVC